MNGTNIAIPLNSEGKRMQNKQMNEQLVHKDSVIFFPTSAIDETAPKKRRSWFFRRLLDLGIIEMAGSQTTKGWNINPTSITTVLALLTFFTVLCGYLWNMAYEKGKLDAQIIILQERLTAAEAEAKKAKEMQIYNSDRHDEPEKKNKKER